MSAIEAIAAERQRQIEAEGWTPEHDDEHDDGQLAKAASCYASPPDCTNRHFDWPWAMEWWKPSEDRRRELVKAAALIVAEIERLDRAALTALQVTERKTMRIVEADPIVLEDEQGIYGRVTEGDKVERLVIAARNVAFSGLFDGCAEDQRTVLRELDQASEAFASCIPWEDEPHA
jgi:hypothetical protein